MIKNFLVPVALLQMTLGVIVRSAERQITFDCNNYMNFFDTPLLAVDVLNIF